MDGRQSIACAALLYPYTIDSNGSTAVADAARRWGFVNPPGGRTVDDLPSAVPLFLARAGQDQAPLNQALDGFVVNALARNLPITCVNHPAGAHAFDTVDDSAECRRIIRQVLLFLTTQLTSTSGAIST